VTAELNKLSSVEIPQNEIWGDRSTPKNKFRYLANSITLFDFFDTRKEGYKEPIKIKSNSEKAIVRLLKASDPKKSKQSDYYGNWWWIK
jgi:hypothetical protein